MGGAGRGGESRPRHMASHCEGEPQLCEFQEELVREWQVFGAEGVDAPRDLEVPGEDERPDGGVAAARCRSGRHSCCSLE